MGYYTGTAETEIFLSKEHFNDVYKKMCELNDYHDLKRGGSFGGNNDNVEGDRYPRNKWFSWMDYNYPELCPDMDTILTRLGFDTTYDDDGNLIDLSYWDKTGSEDYFLSCFAGFIKDGSYIVWKGEENEDYYRHTFKDGKMIFQRGIVSIDYDSYTSEVYEFGKMNSDDVALAEWKKRLDADKNLELNNN